MKYYDLNKLHKLSKKEKIIICMGARGQGKFPFAPKEGENNE